MATPRTVRLNSLLKEVISEVIRNDVRNPHVNPLFTVTRVEITKDLHYAKVFVSVIAGTKEEKDKTIAALQTAAGFIAVAASKKVTMRYFPALTFKLDEGVDKHMRIEEILREIESKRPSEQENKSDDSHSTES